MATDADFARIGNYARLYNPDQNIDRRKAHRTVPIEVICPGFSRTGTLSMHKALSILGYPSPYHFSSALENVQDCDMWTEALDAKYYGKGEIPGKDFFDSLLGHVSAVTDAPCNLFAKELVEFYPDAKVVLVERNVESWYASWMAFCKNSFNPVLYHLARCDPYWMGRMNKVGYMITSIQSGFATNLNEARVRSKAAYLHHYRDIKEAVPKERMLEFKLESGWAPLCEFLGKPIPDVPFPFENEKRANTTAFMEIGTRAQKNILKNLLLVSSVGTLLVAFLWYKLY
ncbi:P-loop containing nucleoside triphosphate hydrolase protein [Xylariales sp. PMI_506]|nr:P-loop containing nucleoside triphosphate hydrolase protein [Xylariales sp. PMI_506]